MKAKIIKIDPLKESRTEKAYRRMYFMLEDSSWAKTDVVPNYRNYKNWKPMIDQVDMGNEVFVEGLMFRGSQEIDADSPVRFADTGFEIIKKPEEKFVQTKLI